MVLHRQVGRDSVNLKNLDLSHSEWSNSQKLRYFDLIEKVFHEDGSRDGGLWRITDRGVQFLMGSIAVPEYVWTYRGERVEYDPDARLVTVEDTQGGFLLRSEWAAEARPRGAA